jgi:hypothetical protein
MTEIYLKPHWVSDDAWFVYDDESFLGEVYRAIFEPRLWYAVPHARAEKAFPDKEGAVAWIVGAP